MIDFNEMREYLNSPEFVKAFEKAAEEYSEKFEREDRILESQLERFHKYTNFEEILEKIINKYNSKEYKDRWYSRSIMPPETLFWFIYNYAEKYGRAATREEWDTYGNMFTSSLYYINGYIFNQMDGQGSIIKITKIK